jgi:DNA end-binding protein Ku
MKSTWNGTIGFGLVNIAVKVFSATRSNELSFHPLHQEDMGRVGNERICKKCGRSLVTEDLVRGYEYEKGKYLPLTEEDFEKVNVESTKHLAILDFVDAEGIDPMFFDKSYYLTPDGTSDKLYALLREVLKRTNKVGIGKIVFHEREHLAAIRPNDRALLLGILYFAEEIKPPKGSDLPAQNIQLEAHELEMAERVVERMTGHFHPERYKDTYREGLLDLIDKKRKGEEIKVKLKRREATNVVDLMAKLKASIRQAA